MPGRTEMHLVIDFLLVEEVGPLIGKARLDLRVAHLRERLAPEHLRLALLRLRRDGAGVLLPQIAVDDEEPLQQALGRARVDRQPRRVRRDGRDDAIEEGLVDRNLRLQELLVRRLMIEGRRGLVAAVSRAKAVIRAWTS